MTTPHRFLTSLLCVFGFFAVRVFAVDAPAAKPRHVLAVLADRPDALYHQGETVTFRIRLDLDDRPATAAEVQWTTSKDGVAPMQKGRAVLRDGQATITGRLDEPGFLQCRVAYEAGDLKLNALAGAGVDPLLIKPSLPVPDDFDAFWTAKKAQLSAMPIEVKLTAVASAATGVEAFDLQATSLGAPVSGYLAVPAGARSKSLPAILTVHGAGVRSAGLSAAVEWARQGALALDINAHGLPNGRPAEFYQSLTDGELKGYSTRGRDSRETIYFLGMFLRLIRAIDVLAARPEWDGKTVVVYGSSQGGAQALAAAGLDSRVTFFVAGVPAMCDHTGALASRIAGWPKFIPTAETLWPEVVAAVRYYDTMNFAARIKAAGFFTVGFIDTTCPPTTVYATYNVLRAPKEIFHNIAAGHTNTPEAIVASRAAVLAHFAAQKSR